MFFIKEGLGMINRRAYDRIYTNTKVLVYCNNREWTLRVKDISENGIAFLCEVSEEIEKHIKIGDTISFTLLDKYTLFCVEHEVVLVGRCQVVRLDNSGYKNGCKILGCKLINPDEKMINYIDNKRVEAFLGCIHSKK